MSASLAYNFDENVFDQVAQQKVGSHDPLRFARGDKLLILVPTIEVSKDANAPKLLRLACE